MQSMASGRVSLSSGLKVAELKDKLAELGLSTQGNKDILRERLHSFLDAGSSNEQDIHVENLPNETKMVADDTEMDDEIAPSLRTASDTDGSLVSSSDYSEDFDIRTKLNSICKDIELLKSNFERLKRSNDLPANSSQVEALENENMALKIQLKDVEAERDSQDSLKLALTCLAKDLNGLIYNQESTEKIKNPKKQARKPLLTMALGSKLKTGNKEMQIRSKLRTKIALHWRITKVALHQMKK